MTNKQRKNMRARRAILLTLRLCEESVTANQLVARMTDLQADGKIARNFGMPNPRTLANMLRGWKGIANEHIYPADGKSKILSYQLVDFDAAEAWLRGDA